MVAGDGGMKLYLNGILVGENDFKGGFSEIKNKKNDLIVGKAQWAVNQLFEGRIDELRIWDTARNKEEINEYMYKKPKPHEKGLVAAYDFDNSTANDFSGNRNYGELCGNPKFIEVNLPKGKELIRPTIIYGKATDVYGKPFENAIVETNHLKTDKITTDQEGNYKICLLPKQEHIDLNIYNETHSAWKTNLKIGQGEVRKLNMTLRPSMDFEGRITAYDNSSQFMIVVQALLIDEKSKIEKVEQATLSEKN